MQYRYPLLVLLSTLVLVIGSYGSYRAFRPSGFPFTVKVVSAHAALIKPSLGIPLPTTLQAGGGQQASADVIETDKNHLAPVTLNPI